MSSLRPLPLAATASLRFAAIREKGTVDNWNDAKGFGFIKDAMGLSYFVYFKDLVTVEGGYRALEQGQEVSFTIGTAANDSSKLRAERVCRLDGSPLPSGTKPRPPAANGGELADAGGRPTWTSSRAPSNQEPVEDLEYEEKSWRSPRKSTAIRVPESAERAPSPQQSKDDLPPSASSHKSAAPGLPDSPVAPQPKSPTLTDYGRGFLEGYYAAMESFKALSNPAAPAATRATPATPTTPAAPTEAGLVHLRGRGVLTAPPWVGSWARGGSSRGRGSRGGGGGGRGRGDYGARRGGGGGRGGDYGSGGGGGGYSSQRRPSYHGQSNGDYRSRDYTAAAQPEASAAPASWGGSW